MKKLRILCLLLIIVFYGLDVYAEEVLSDQIMSADLPFVYGEEEFINRIDERASGRAPVGLVLSGGSARAFAHIGVLRRLEELGIVPDFIVTNSMGSIVGLLYGAGYSPDQISEIIQSTNIGELFKIVFPSKGGIINVGKFSGLIHSFTGDLELSELPIPVMVLCEDIETKRQVRIAEGNFDNVMQAAFSLPFYFSPVKYKDHLLMDGGLSNLVPLEAAYNYSDTIIASTTFYSNPDLNLRNPITNINVALDIGKSRAGVSQIKKYKPVLIRCDVESFSFMEFGSMPEIQDRGYVSAEKESDVLSALETAGVTDELLEIRKKNQEKIDKAFREYRYLESIPSISSEAEFAFFLKNYNNPGSSRYLNNDLQFNGGVDYSVGGFDGMLSGGIGINSTESMSLFPVVNAEFQWDIFYALRMNCSYSLRFRTDELSEDFDIEGFLGSSDLFVGFRYIPYADEYSRFGLFASSEAQFNDDAFSELLLTGGTSFFVQSSPLSEENCLADLDVGLQVKYLSWPFELNNASAFTDLDFSLPVPFTDGILKIKGRGVGRMPVVGTTVNYYIRDAMKSSLSEGEYSTAGFAETGLIFDPYFFRPTFAELLMLNEIEAGVFGSAGWFDKLVWSSGVSLSADVSLIGLKPFSFEIFAGYDSLSTGVIWGVSFGS